MTIEQTDTPDLQIPKIQITAGTTQDELKIIMDNFLDVSRENGRKWMTAHPSKVIELRDYLLRVIQEVTSINMLGKWNSNSLVIV